MPPLRGLGIWYRSYGKANQEQVDRDRVIDYKYNSEGGCRMKINIKRNMFPGGKTKVLTMSYDDGVTQDEKLIDIFDKYSIKGTFNLNSGYFGQVDEIIVRGDKTNHSHIPAEKIKDIYLNHEVAIHTFTHPHLTELTKEMFTYEVIEDKKNLEELVGYPVRGMAYPYGTYNDRIIQNLKELNIEYARNVITTNKFGLPKDFLAWDGTCHHNNENLLKLAKDFIQSEERDQLSLFYVWGHSYEFDAYNNWTIIEEFCELVGNNSNVWYATNIEIVDYINSQNLLKFSCTGSSVYNPSGVDVWISVDGKAIEVKKGCIVKLK